MTGKMPTKIKEIYRGYVIKGSSPRYRTFDPDGNEIGIAIYSSDEPEVWRANTCNHKLWQIREEIDDHIRWKEGYYKNNQQ